MPAHHLFSLLRRPFSLRESGGVLPPKPRRGAGAQSSNLLQLPAPHGVVMACPAMPIVEKGRFTATTRNASDDRWDHSGLRPTLLWLAPGDTLGPTSRTREGRVCERPFAFSCVVPHRHYDKERFLSGDQKMTFNLKDGLITNRIMIYSAGYCGTGRKRHRSAGPYFVIPVIRRIIA